MIRPVIMSGGAGTRLWPMSRQGLPKQLLPIASERSMLQDTALRVLAPGFAPPVVIGGEEHRHFITRQLHEVGVVPDAIILEPVKRNTAAVAAVAAEWALTKGGQDLILLMPSDHVIRDRDAFMKAVGRARSSARAGSIITFGIWPSEPQTQYGYIGADFSDANGSARIDEFIEKPDLEVARRLIKSNRHLWNSGIFLFDPTALLRELDKFLPDTRDAIARAMADSSIDGQFLRPDPAAFEKAENISLDYAVMQKTEIGRVVPVDMGWSDVGSWASFHAHAPKDERGNVVSADVLALDCRNSVLRSDGSITIAAIGMEDVVVVGTRDAVLVAPLSRSEDVKEAVRQLEAEGRRCATLPSQVARPWGSYETLDAGMRFQIKHIKVDAGQQISLQKHYHRSEHWVVVQGTAEVTIDGNVSLLQENESTFIRAGSVHRLRNPGKVSLELVEVQCGTYLEEDDIVRLEDDYGRR